MFYDYETFGKNPYLDKPAQFSCIRTDNNFNIIDFSEDFFCRLPFDYLPDPEAILVTGISPEYTKIYGLDEFYFAKKIHNLFMRSNTCIIGYNNIYFDDEFTRAIFYRNFLDPYEWSWKNGNSRWDILDVLRACYVLRPNGINWPINHNNMVSFKLSDISSVNNIVHENVHNAVSDVYATIQITKLLKLKQPKLFNFFFKFRTKFALLKLFNINTFSPIIYISRYFGAKNNSVSWIVPILWHPFNKNILICVDLSKDFKLVLNFFNKKDIVVSVNDYKQLFLIGVQFIYMNRCPILAPINSMTSKDILRLKINVEMYYKNLRLLRNHLFIIEKIKLFFCQPFKTNNNTNPDLQIYNAFFSPLDKIFINKIHNLLPQRTMTKKLLQYDNRLSVLLIYCIARNFPNMLYHTEKIIWKKHCFEIYNNKNIKKNIDKINELCGVHKDNFKNILLLQELLKYINDCLFRFNKK